MKTISCDVCGQPFTSPDAEATMTKNGEALLHVKPASITHPVREICDGCKDMAGIAAWRALTQIVAAVSANRRHP